MLDLGWAEILIIAVAALIVVGPKDLPRMLRTLGQYAARAKGVAREFQRSMDEAARQADLDELRDVKKDLDKDVAGVRDAQYKMQREMSQSFLDEGKKPKKEKAGAEEPAAAKSDAAKPAAAKPAAGNGEAGAGEAPRTSGDGSAPAAGTEGAEPEPKPAPEAKPAPEPKPAAKPKPAPKRKSEPKRKPEPSAGKVGGA